MTDDKTRGKTTSLADLGISEQKVKEYERGLSEGGILVAVQPLDAHSHEVLKKAWGPLEGKRSERGEIENTESAEYTSSK
jgi:hypothetical protein